MEPVCVLETSVVGSAAGGALPTSDGWGTSTSFGLFVEGDVWSSSLLRFSPLTAAASDGGEVDVLMRNFKGGIFGRFASSSRRLQSSQMKWKSSFSATSCGMPRHLLCCQTLHRSQATLWVPSSYSMVSRAVAE